MICNILIKPVTASAYVMETFYTRLVPNRGVVGDALCCFQSTYEDYDFVEYSRQFKSSDFDIQSLLSVGAYDMMKPTYVSSISSMDFADKFQSINLKPQENV